MQINQRKRLLGTVVLLAFLAVGCGSKKPVVKDVGVTPYVDGKEVYASIEAEFEINNLKLPSLSVPIRHPKGNEVVGYFVMSGTSKNLVGIEINLSAVSRLERSRGVLPNGSPLPIFGMGQDLVELDIPTGNGNNPSKLYVSWSQGTTIVGFAVPIKHFDKIGQRVKGEQVLMPSFRIKGIPGAAGVYVSPVAGSNGLSAFFDLSSVFTLPELQPDNGAGDSSQSEQSQWIMSSTPSSSRSEQRMSLELYKLDKKATRLEVAE